MAKNKVSHFEIPASDFKSAKKFYDKVFDWKIEMWGDEGAMVYTTKVDKDDNLIEAGGINGNLYKRQSKSQQPSIVVETESIDETLKKIKESGGKITSPKHSIGEWGYMAEFSDPEGNNITLWEDIEKK